MTDTPDFDKMSPEEIMKWMESLAVRQGVTEGLTTSADMDVGNVSEDDERLKDKGEYIPYGMKKEEWEKQKAKEDEQKRQRLAAQPPAAAKPAPQPVQAPPPPQPVQAPPPPAQPAPAAAVSDTPDFDKMSPEEIMKWMESLAVRQGATEGLLTSADAQIAEVNADDERLKGKGDYIPFGMKQAEWDKQKEKEEEQKRQRLAAKPATPPAAVQPPPTPVQPAASIEPMNALNDFLSGDLPNFENEIEEETVIAQPASNPVDWLVGLTEDSADDNFNFGALNDTDDPLAALAELSNGSDDSMDWLTGLGSDTGLGLESLADLVNTGAGSDEDDDPLSFLNSLAEPAAPVKPASQPTPRKAEESLEWLESMARDQGANPEELMTPASLNVTRPTDVRPDGPGYTPYSFETASDSTSDETAVPAEADLSFLNESEDASEDWLDEVARNVATDGHAPKAPARSAEPTPAPKADVASDVMSLLNSGKQVDPNDISKMFESFFQQAEQYADKDFDFDETAAPAADHDSDIPDEALQAEIPDWLRDQMISSAPADEGASSDSQKMESLMKMFDEETPALDSFTAQIAEPVSDMPDWLRNTPEDELPAIANDLAGLDTDLPDWLQATEGEESDENIFAATQQPWDDVPGLLALPTDELDDDDLGELDEDGVPERGFELDTSDRWVEALTLEEEAGDQLAQWYAEKTGEFSEDMMPQLDLLSPVPTSAVTPSQPSRTGSLRAAQLPVEAVLMLGEAEGAPEWLTGTATMPAAVAIAQTAPSEIAIVDDDSDIPDWLREQTDQAAATSDLDAIPDWLRDQVDDSVTSEAGVPSWLAGDDDIEGAGDDLPDWLRETMAEEETPSVTSFTPPVETTMPTVIMAAPTLPTPVSTSVPAPVPSKPVAITPAPTRGISPIPSQINIDVASTLQAARGKVSSGDVDGSLADYELIVRANTALDEVVKDLSKLADHKDHKRNPALYRVLGDTLMRRGDLKTALETYRKALHML